MKSRHQITLALAAALEWREALADGPEAVDRRGESEPSVIILEKLDRVGRKILATGNGRCNLSNLEAAPGHPRHGDALADLVTELIEAGMDYYFMRALKQAKVGFVTEQSARMGMSGAVKLISSVNRKFIVRMDKDQLLVVAQHIRELG